MTHPLTDEICRQIQDSTPELPCDEHGKALSYDGQRILDGMFEEMSEVSRAEMRSAADWQLEQVIEWLKDNVSHSLFLEVGVTYPIDFDWIVDDLKKAMRPTNTQEDN